MIRKLMVPVRGDGKGDNVFAHAAAIAKAFSAHVQIVHCRPNVEDLMPFGVVIPSLVRSQIEDTMATNAEMDEARLRDEFKELAAHLGLPIAEADGKKPTTSFKEYAGKQVDAVKHFGRLSDLICVPRPDKSLNLGANTLKSAIYSSGRGVLMCPPRDEIPGSVGTRIGIAWNGSLKASRALAAAMPMIEKAQAVHIFTTSTQNHAASAEDLKDYLALRGVLSKINAFEQSGNIGRSLLELCATHGADLLVMGAYHDSYERETLFGGNTQVVVDEATIPVVLAH